MITPLPSAGLNQCVGTAQHQRIVRCHHGKADIMRGGEGYDLIDLLRTDLRYANRVGGHTAVARQGVDHADFGTFLQRFDQRVFAATAANYDNVCFHVSLRGGIRWGAAPYPASF